MGFAFKLMVISGCFLIDMGLLGENVQNFSTALFMLETTAPHVCLAFHEKESKEKLLAAFYE